MQNFGSSGLSLEREVANKLWDMGSRFQQNVPVNGLQTDFVLQPSENRQVVLEIKGWPLTKGNVERARHQALFLKEATGSNDSYIVIPGKSAFALPEGVITIDGIDDVVNAQREPGEGFSPSIDFEEYPAFFAAMPFSGEYDDVYYFAMRKAAHQAGGVVKRVDDEKYEGDVVNRIHHMIDGSVAVIADLSEARPNVLYEVGYARGRRISVVPLSSTGSEALPFDVRNWNIISYSKGGAYHIVQTLTERLKAIIDGAA